MTPAAIQQYFTDPEGGFRFARWSCPLVPMIYGVAAPSLPVLKGALRLIADLTGHPLAEPAPDRAQNALTVFVADWAELRGVAELSALLPGLAALSHRLEAERAGRYRVFHFGAAGGIEHCLTLVRLGGTAPPADLLALDLAVAGHLAWGAGALEEGVVGADGKLRADLIAVLRAAYDPALPAGSRDPALAYRLAARLAA
jgi:hypothetical protein